MRNLSVLILVIVLSSCNKTNKHEGLDIPAIEFGSESSINISSFTSKVKSIKLETSEGALLANIKNIEMAGSNVYVTDNVFNGIYIFDTNGKFLKSFNKEGRCYGEYNSLDHFILDEG